MIDLRQMQALMAVAQTGSVARAAKQLGWSQPSVDYHLRNLDRLCGTALVERSTRGSSLTAAGDIMLDRARRILTLSQRALHDVRAYAQSGLTRMKFGTFPTAASALLPSIVKRSKQAGLHIDSTLEEIYQLVAHVNQHDYDAVLLYSVPGYDLPFAPTVSTTEVFREPLQLALPVSHPLARRKSIGVEALVELQDENWLLGSTRDDPIDAIVVDAFKGAGHQLEVEFRTDDYSVMLGMVAAEMVVGLVPLLASMGHHPGVALLPIDDPAFSRSLLVATPHSPAGSELAANTRKLSGIITDCTSLIEDASVHGSELKP
ncbi:LysR family transcriptional regulator [Brevibacterium marinum]|uniref:Molybdate transport repressor ModE-like protein n=1 Tax=Brevibacterium marinum TaxID=418643 RepID=A0A846RMB4_9MICO|nr:LysR family transcriptional regulator [Brevibacterium marinum]NJC54994.1 molybdate transport repressor ModE-like protein [Brevibacterium marinum]